MNCPKCGASSDNGFCPNCKIDISQYSLINKMSIDAYNCGLDLAKENDISNAIVELTKAVQYDRENIKALNLLGLCYDRIGRVSDASKYWIRSCFVVEDNIASEYLKTIEENITKTERINESIKMYNQGLTYLSQGNLDIATIQLKSAIDRNPTFVEAMNLLALSYINQGQKDKAANILTKILKIDSRNSKATRYLNSLDEDLVKKTNKKRIENNNKTDVQKVQKNKGSSFAKKAIIYFLAGLATWFLISTTLIYPSMKSKLQESSNSAEQSYTDQIEQQNSVISSSEQQISDLQAQLETAQAENQTLKTEYESLNTYVQLDTAESLVSSRDYIGAANSIYSINQDTIPADQVERYTQLKDRVYPTASKSLYDTALGYYNSQKYQEAISDFEVSIRYGGTDKWYYPNTLYYIGRCYEGLGDTEQATTYYNKVISEYPDNEIIYSAQDRLTVMAGQ